METNRTRDVLVFDMGGVLMKHNIPACIARFKEILGENFDKLGLGNDGEGTGIMEQFEKGLIGQEEFIDFILSFAKEGTSRKDIIDAWNLMHAGIPEERIDMLHTLKEDGYTLFMLSNNNEIHWRDVCENYNLDGIFDDVFLSFREHCSKPDERIFRTLMDRTGHKASELVFIDDLEANRIAAEKLGWRSSPSIEDIFQKTHEPINKQLS